MHASLNVPPAGALDFLSLGALVHRLDPGIIPFRKAHECQVHVSGGEFNVAANLSDCFRMRTAIATAMVDYPIGDLVAERVRAMGVRPFYKQFAHDSALLALARQDAGPATPSLLARANRTLDLPQAVRGCPETYIPLFAITFTWTAEPLLVTVAK